MFYLVQRLTPRDTHNPEKGFDGYFGCEYMGSAEFEFGAIPKSLKAIRAETLAQAQTEISVKLARMEEPVTRTVYLMGTQKGVQTALDLMQQWVDSGLRAKESTHFDEVATGLSRWSNKPIDEYNTTRAWWALDEDVLWTMDPELVGTLVAALDARPATIPLHP